MKQKMENKKNIFLKFCESCFPLSPPLIKNFRNLAIKISYFFLMLTKLQILLYVSNYI